MFDNKLAVMLIGCSILALTACGSSGGGGSGPTAVPPQPAYVNGTTTGQFTNNDLGYYFGAKTSPVTVTSGTVDPKIMFDIGNGYLVNQSNVKWRVLKNGILFHTPGVNATINATSHIDLEFPITPGAGVNVYRIEIDPTNEFTETNENNNYVELTVSVTAPANG